MLLLARVPMARREAAIGALQQRLLRRGKIRISCPEPADTWPHICIYTTSVWAAQAKPRSSQLATVWPLAVVSHSWCTSSQEGRLNTIVRRREKSSILEILHAFTPQSVEFLFSTGDPTPGGPIVPCAFLQTNALRGSTIAKMLMGHRCDSLGDA